ncbi:hypothetical protein Lal_00003995 [Lupinus albus]|nr:hypothetical protein Lal_00003995 [Lupinus albus]
MFSFSKPLPFSSIFNLFFLITKPFFTEIVAAKIRVRVLPPSFSIIQFPPTVHLFLQLKPFSLGFRLQSSVSSTSFFYSDLDLWITAREGGTTSITSMAASRKQSKENLSPEFTGLLEELLESLFGFMRTTYESSL